MPLVSIVIPVYNVELYLDECVQSVLQQTYRELQIILVDDGSTDSSGKICDRYARQDKRVKVIHKPNGGLSSARNTGLDAADGEYIYFLDSDDYIEPDAIEQLIAVVLNEKADMVFFERTPFYEGLDAPEDLSKFRTREKYPTVDGKLQLLKLLKNGDFRPPVPYCFFRKSYLTEHGFRFKEGIVHEDDLFSFLIYEGNGRIAHCDKILYHIRRRPGSIMTSDKNRLKKFDSMLSIYTDLVGRYDGGEIAGEAAKMYMVRIAKSVLCNKYVNLSADEQVSRSSEIRSFKKNVLQHHGFGDRKLQIKCSGGIGRLYYRGLAKIKRMW